MRLTSSRRISLLACAFAVSALLATRAPAAVIYSVTNSVYAQNFDTLPITPENTSLGTSPTGWTNRPGNLNPRPRP